MKTFLQYGFFGVLVVGFFFLWRAVPLPCEDPIAYSVGTLDARFGLSETEFLKAIATAENHWEQALGRELFRYAPESTFAINLIFDDRQERTIEAGRLESSLVKTQDIEENLKQKQETVLERYEGVRKAYESMLASFQKRLAAYNAEVEKWNQRGGAPEDIFEELENVSRSLKKESAALETKRRELNQLVEELNAFSARSVALVDAYNEEVNQYVHRYGEPREFDQGEYVGEEINIYQYDDLPHLELVLTHELGHALGLGHGADPRSVMFHLMKDQELDPLTLTAEDISMISVQCNQTVWDIVLQRIEMGRQWLVKHEDNKGFLGL